MVSIKSFRDLALSFPGVTEQPHFEKTAFRSAKRIFATLSEDGKTACVKFSEIDQSVFCTHNDEVIFPVANKWGKQGWTNIVLSQVRKSVLKDAMETAYNESLSASPKR